VTHSEFVSPSPRIDRSDYSFISGQVVAEHDALPIDMLRLKEDLE